MKPTVIYKSKDTNKIQKGDIVKIARIISSDTFFSIIKKHPSKIEISQSVLKQTKRLDSIIKALEITKKYKPIIEVKRYE